MEEKKQYSALTIDRAAFLLLRVKKAFKKKKLQRKERERNSRSFQRKLNAIDKDVQRIRQEIEKGQLNQQAKTKYKNTLQKYSNELNNSPPKCTDIARNTKNLINVSLNLLEERNEDERRTSRRREECAPEVRRSLKRRPEAKTENSSPLDVVKHKMLLLQIDIETAEDTKDFAKLQVLKTSIKDLLSELGSVDVNNSLRDSEKKRLLEKSILRNHANIIRIEKELDKEIKLKNLTEKQKEYKCQESLKYLDKIDEEIQAFTANLTLENLEEAKEALKNFKNKIEEIDYFDNRIHLKKSEVFDTLLVAENEFTKLDIQKKLTRAEEEVDGEEDLPKLLQLKDEVNAILEITEAIDKKKKAVIEKIDNKVKLLHKNNEDEQVSMKKEIQEIHKTIDHIKKQINSLSPLNKKDLSKLRESLVFSVENLNKIDDGEDKKHLQEDIQTYSSRIEELLKISRNVKDDDVMKILENIEKELEGLKPRVEVFSGTLRSDEYFELDDALIRNTLKLDGLKFEKGSELHNKKIQLLREINKYNDILDKKVQEN